MADGAPMSDERARIAPDVHPADQGIAGPRDEEPAAFRAEASEELVSDRCDVGDIDRKKWEPDRPSGVADQDPAVDKLASQARRDCSGLVIWLISGSIRSPTQEVCQAAASSCRYRPALPLVARSGGVTSTVWCTEVMGRCRVARPIALVVR